MYMTLYAHAQLASDTIEVRTKPMRTLYYYHGLRMTDKQLVKLFENNDTAYQLLQSALTYKGLSFVLSLTGGYFLGMGTAQSILSGTLVPLPVMGGITLIVVSIPATITYNRRKLRAVGIYNRGCGLKPPAS
jgi:hypothetical protein